MATSKYITKSFQHTNCCLMIISGEGCILYANSLLINTLHLEEKFPAKNNIYDLLTPEKYDAFKGILAQLDQVNAPAVIDLPLKNGVIHPMKWQINKLSSSSPAINYLCIGQHSRQTGGSKATQPLQFMADKTEHGILLVDKFGQVIEANPMAAQLLQTTLENLYHKNALEELWKTFQTTNRSVPFEQIPPMKALRTGKAESKTITLTSKAGNEQLSLAWNAQPLFNPQQTVAFAVLSFFSEQDPVQQQETMRKEAEAVAKTMIGHSPNVCWAADEAGYLVFANASFYRRWGLDKEPADKNIYAIAPKNIADQFVEKHRRVIETNLPYRKVHHFSRQDGTTCSFLVNLYPVKGNAKTLVGGEAVEITDKYKIYEQAKKLNERLLQVSRLSSDAVWEWNMETGEMFRNNTLHELIGIRIEKAHDLSWWFQRIHPDDRNRVQESIDELIAKKGRYWHQDYKFLCADGSYKNMADRGYIEYQHGKAVRMIGSLQNISELKELESMLRQEKIAHETKMAQTIVKVQEQERAYIGHELHDNVTQILGSARLYLDMIKPNSENEIRLKEKVSDFIFTAIEEIRSLSQQLATPALKTESLIDTIEELFSDIRNTGLFHVKFTVQLDAGVEFSLAEEKRIALLRIVQEQINNIIKHSHAKNIRVNLTQQATGIILYIYDDGVGFDPSQANKITGLSNIYARIKLFNGSVDIVSAPGEGCSLTVLMPF